MHNKHLGLLVALLDGPLLGNHELLRWNLPLQLISTENHPISFAQNVQEILQSMDGVDLGEHFYVSAVVAKDVSDLFDVVAARGKRQHKEVDVDCLGNSPEVPEIILIQEWESSVFSAHKSDLTIGPQRTANFDLKHAALTADFKHDADYLTVV
jgi:hypothetical protein